MRFYSSTPWHIRYASSVATVPRRSRGRPRKDAAVKPGTYNNELTESGSVKGTNRGNHMGRHASQSGTGTASDIQSHGKETQEESGLPQRNFSAASESNTTSAATATDQSPVRRTPREGRSTPRMHMSAVAKHTDLESFLEYASRVELNPSTNVYRGTHYEYTVAKTLEAYGFSLHRTGRSNDLGIDLIGHWALPGDNPGFRVLIQCKATQSTPSMIRELEGSFAGAPAGWNGPEALALLATVKTITPGVLQATQRSRFAMGVLQIRTDGSLQQFIWNQAAEQARLSGLTVANTYSKKHEIARPEAIGCGNVESSIALLWRGAPWKRAPR